MSPQLEVLHTFQTNKRHKVNKKNNSLWKSVQHWINTERIDCTCWIAASVVFGCTYFRGITAVFYFWGLSNLRSFHWCSHKVGNFVHVKCQISTIWGRGRRLKYFLPRHPSKTLTYFLTSQFMAFYLWVILNIRTIQTFTLLCIAESALMLWHTTSFFTLILFISSTNRDNKFPDWNLTRESSESKVTEI